MTLTEIITSFRSEARDELVPYLWSDTEVTRWANEAEMEAARRSGCIGDNDTAAICAIAYTTNSTLTLDTRVIEIRSAIITGQTLPLVLAVTSWMDANYPGWLDATTGMPRVLVTDWGLEKVRLYPPPAATGTLNLRVIREPLTVMATGTDEPEISARWHPALVWGVLARAYRVDDTETKNEQLSQMYDARFASEFGERKSARNEAWALQYTGQMSDALA